MNLDIKTYKLRLKAVDDAGRFEGYASVFGNEDSYGDIVEPGAFAKTIADTGGIVPILWQHNPYEPIGVSDELAEDARGLKVAGQLNLETQRGREARALLQQGALKGLSIGYQTVKQQLSGAVRHLLELKLWEFSPVTFPANELAQVTAVKNGLFGLAGLQLLEGYADLFVKGIVAFADLPVADRGHEWDGAAAVQRLEKWAADSDGDIDMRKFSRGFCWYDSSSPDTDHDDGFPDAVGAYKLPIADVVDDELQAVPAAIFAAAAVLQGARGGADIPDADQQRIRANLSRYYAKMRRQFDDESIVAPWDTTDGKAGRVLSASSRSLVEQAVSSMGDAAKALQALLDAAEPADATRGKGAAAHHAEPALEATLRAFTDHVKNRRETRQ